ncbi:Amidohydrolase family protein [Tenacibaculum sp. 190524A02b]|uniref:amidohydrolase family protein n=1 Tax=Tenacibaculum vairaonense TaxID=3137860 RepID=UPI0032B1858A
MRTNIIILITIFFSIGNVKAQIPNRIKQSILQFIKKTDKLNNSESIKSKVAKFSSNAPNEKVKYEALKLMLEKSNSDLVKKVLKELLKNKKVIRNNTQKIPPKKEDSYTLLKGAIVIDAVSDIGKKGDILIMNDKIVAISYNNTIKTPENTEVYNLEGKYIIPGLIDGHVHITHGTLKEGQKKLELALKQGVTGVRDMGGDGRMLALLKRNMKIEEYKGADVFFSTILAGPNFFKHDNRPQSVAKGAIAGKVSWQMSITNQSDFRDIISQVKGLGATAIKVYQDVDKHVFKKVANEAHKQGLKVWAHAVIRPAKAIDVTNGGADVMSHASDLIQYEFLQEGVKQRHEFSSREEARAYAKKLNSYSWDKNTYEVKQLFKAMKKNNSILDATLFVNYYTSKPTDSLRYKKAVKNTKIAYDMGVKISAGSDHILSIKEDNIPFINIHKELELLVNAGLTNIDALKAATIINAEVLGEEKNIGSIEKGKQANLVILNANPLDNITNTKKIKMVIKRGKIIN